MKEINERYQYTTAKNLKQPEHSSMNLFGSLLTIKYEGWQIGKSFRKNSIGPFPCDGIINVP